MTHPTLTQTTYHNGTYYALYSDGTLQRRRLGGAWEVVPLGEWPEVK